MRRWIRDWWRGYSDCDRSTLEAKLASSADLPVGSVISLTRGQYKCFLAGDYDCRYLLEPSQQTQ